MHIKGLFDKFQGCAWLLTPAEILYGMSDKLQQIHEPTGRNLQKDMIHEVKQCKYLEALIDGEELRTERNGRSEETGTQGDLAASSQPHRQGHFQSNMPWGVGSSIP